MVKTILIVTTADREHLLARLLYSIERHRPRVRDWYTAAVLQGYSGEGRRRLEGMSVFRRLDEVEWLPDSIGPHSARVAGLRRLEGRTDIYCNLDDDCELTEFTDFESAGAKALEFGVGLVGTGWAWNRMLLARPIPSEPRFWPRILVRTGGGLLYGRDVAQEILRYPDRPYRHDDVEWSLVSYLSGRQNLFFPCSVGLHAMDGVGGRAAWAEGRELVGPDPTWIRWEERPGPYRLAPADRDVTRRAREDHCAAREKLLRL